MEEVNVFTKDNKDIFIDMLNEFIDTDDEHFKTIIDSLEAKENTSNCPF